MVAQTRPRRSQGGAGREGCCRQEARLAQNKTAVSVFISRKTQRLYVRQGLQPMFESEVTIA